MAKSFARGDYHFVTAFESSSSAGAWYRVLQDKETRELSCDCPGWLHKKEGQERTCKHTETAATLLRGAGRAGQGTTTPLPSPTTPHELSLVTAIKDQWRGMDGEWGIQERDARVGKDRYRFVLITLRTATGLEGSAVAAFAHKHGLSTARLIPASAGWIGYNIAAQVAQAAGFAMVGQPPEHYKFRTGSPSRPGRISLHDILRVADHTDLGDGLTPAQRAENTLQLFLGDLYTTMTQQGFLDVPSSLYATEQRVYRLRRDPARHRERRVRVFENAVYKRDLCVVRAADVPEADHFLTVFLQLVADEASVLAVVRQHNVFGTNSDGNERETVPAVWRPRPQATIASAN